MRCIMGKWCGKNKTEQVKEKTRLYLNVYDLTPTLNNYLYWFGLGIFHSGIQVHGREYGFGAHEYSTSGVFEVEPGTCPRYTFRKSIPLGTTDMSSSEFRSFLQHLASNYHGDSYNLIAKNCNHFTNEVCTRLTGKSIPGWVNRLARLAASSFVNCLLSEQNQITAASPDHSRRSEGDSESRTSSEHAESEDVVDDSDHHLLTSSTENVGFLQSTSARMVWRTVSMARSPE